MMRALEIAYGALVFVASVVVLAWAWIDQFSRVSVVDPGLF